MPADAQRTMNRWEALAILMTLAFLNYLDRMLLPPLARLIQDDLGLSNTQYGALATGFHVVYAVAAPLIGVFADRMTRKTILLLSVIVWSVVTAASGLAQGFISLLLLRALTGLGEGGYFPTAASLIGDLFAARQRGLALALHGVFVTLGGGAGQMIGGWLGGRFGWRMPFFLTIVPGLLLSALLWIRFREPPRGALDVQPTGGAAPASQRSYLRIVLSAPVLMISLAAALASFALNGMTQFVPKFLEDALKVPTAQAGLLSGFAFWATLVGQLAGGVLSDWLVLRVRGVRPLLMGVPYLLAAPALWLMAAVSQVYVVLLAWSFAMIARGFAEPNIYGTVIDSVSAHERGSAQGFMLCGTFAGASLGTLLTGKLIDAAGYGTAIPTLAAISAVAGALGVALSVLLRRRGASPAASAR